jgi:hypothetical protein
VDWLILRTGSICAFIAFGGTWATMKENLWSPFTSLLGWNGRAGKACRLQWNGIFHPVQAPCIDCARTDGQRHVDVATHARTPSPPAHHCRCEYTRHIVRHIKRAHALFATECAGQARRLAARVAVQCIDTAQTLIRATAAYHLSVFSRSCAPDRGNELPHERHAAISRKQSHPNRSLLPTTSSSIVVVIFVVSLSVGG